MINPQTTIALTFLAYIISGIDGVPPLPYPLPFSSLIIEKLVLSL